MQSNDRRRAPSIPKIGNSSLIVWAGYHSPVKAADVDRRVVGAIAKPLVHAGPDSTAIAAALDAGLGVVLPGEAWRNQLPLDHPKRSEAFQRLSFAQPGVLDPMSRWPSTFIEPYAADHLDAQMKRGGTIITTAAHYLRAEGGDGRENDLDLAKAGVAAFRARGGHHPAREEWPARAVFASIMVESLVLPDAVDRLVEQYSKVEADGFWIVIANTRRSATEIRATAQLAFGLEAVTGKPAVVSCVGRPQPTFLVHGIAAVCSGHNRGSFAFPPYEMPEPEPGEDETGIGVFVYHERVRGAPTLDEDGQALLARLFECWPCHCGAHRSDEPPVRKPEKEAHNQRVLEREAAEICALPPGQRPELMRGWLSDAMTARRELGMTPLGAGWRAIDKWRDEFGAGQQQTGS